MTELAAGGYVYEDVPAFIAAIQHLTAGIAVITHGTPRFQRLKWSLAPEIHGLPFHAILEPKAAFIARTYPGRHGTIIDDKAVRDLPQGFAHIWIDRTGGQGRYRSLTDMLPEITAIAQTYN